MPSVVPSVELELGLCPIVRSFSFYHLSVLSTSVLLDYLHIVPCEKIKTPRLQRIPFGVYPLTYNDAENIRYMHARIQSPIAGKNN